MSKSPVLERHDLICPITFEVYRDPVRASDGYVYERSAIVRWIAQQETSPLTREPLDINDLRPEENIKQLCQPYQSNSSIYSIEISTISSSSSLLTIQPSASPEQTSLTKDGNFARILVKTTAACLIISVLISTTFAIFLFHSSKSISSIVSNSTEYTTRTTTTIYQLPNNCILSNKVILFSWNNVLPFGYTYYSKVYKAVSTQTMITFAFHHDPSYWCLDDVSIIDILSNTEIITNGHFENKSSNGFIRCNMFGNSSAEPFLTSLNPYNGRRSFCDGAVGKANYLNQILHTKIDREYRISFWLQNKDDTPNSAQVILSY